MKNSLFSIFLFIILLGFLTYADINFKNLCSNVVLKCEELEETINYLPKEESFENAMEIYDLIENKGKLASIYINHLDYDVILNEALKLTVYIEKDDYSEAFASLHLLKSNTQHMKELQIPNIENIF